MTKVFIVESPSKARTIKHYLGSDYCVLASYGHIRDLPSKTGSVNPDNNFSVIWSIEEKSKSVLLRICHSLKGATELILATDPDREGEAIAWHLKEFLQEKGVLKSINVQRVIFYEITREAILYALDRPCSIDMDLVESYFTRRILDYLVGFTLSPLLWRKLPGSRSAGRVQSVALRLIHERESEIEQFNSSEYWSIFGFFLRSSTSVLAPTLILKTKLTTFNGRKVSRLDFKSKSVAENIRSELKKNQYHVYSIFKFSTRKSPPIPFITSTLQQESFKKLGFSISKTMRIAQQLYEGKGNYRKTGLITYMRTNNRTISQGAATDIRNFIERTFSVHYLSKRENFYLDKREISREAHEAIRPINILEIPNLLNLEDDQKKLYELIWERTVTSQMTDTIFDNITVNIISKDKKIIFQIVCSKTKFEGFLALNRIFLKKEDLSNKVQEEIFGVLASLQEGESIDLEEVTLDQNFTSPPKRYTEATLVEKLEELGIGRPSTYALIISTLLKRGYVSYLKKYISPNFRGRIVSSFLKKFFGSYITYEFTARLEERLDEIACGRLNSKTVLKQFWSEFSEILGRVESIGHLSIISSIEKDLLSCIFPTNDYGEQSRLCPQCQIGNLSLKLSKFSYFISCSFYPKCSYTRPLKDSISDQEINFKKYSKKLSYLKSF